MSAERIDVHPTEGVSVIKTTFAVGDEVRVPEVPHWPKGEVISIDKHGRPHIRWENGFVDVFNWLYLEKIPVSQHSQDA